jgi:FSR family fosmidomycin resistance protein-like MFS transporter
MAGILAMWFQLAASVVQLGFGYLADRWKADLLLRAGPVVAIVMLSLIGWARTPFEATLILILGGLGCAAFHPSAATLTHRLGGTRPGLAMSVYISGGTFGFSFGPLFFAPLVERYGIGATPFLMMPGLIALALLVRRVPVLRPDHAVRDGGWRTLKPYTKTLILLYVSNVMRTLAALGFATFVPVMLTQRGVSVSQAGAIVAMYLFASGLGGFISGPAADRFGPRAVIAGSMLIAAPLLAATPLLSGWALTIVLALGGFFVQSSLPVNVTYAHTIVPVSAATVSSLMMGFAWGSGGLAVPLAGFVADRIGLPYTLTILGLMPIGVALCVWPLPEARALATAARPSDVGIAEPE